MEGGLVTAEEVINFQNKINYVIQRQADAIERLCIQLLRLLKDPAIAVKYDEKGAMIIHHPIGKDPVTISRVDVVGVITEAGDGALEIRAYQVCSKLELEALCDVSQLPENLH